MTAQKIVTRLGYTGLVLFPNHDLFNFFAQGTPLVVWKQVLAGALAGFGLVLLTKEAKYSSAARLGAVTFGVLLGLTVALILYSLGTGIPAGRVIYGALSYVGVIGAVSFGIASHRVDRAAVLLATVYAVAFVGAAGIVVDYFLPIFDFLPRSFGNEFETQFQLGYFRRAAFLFGASTVVFPFLSFGLLAAAIRYREQSKGPHLFALAVLAVLSVVAIYLTGSRANLVLLLTFISMLYLWLLRHSPLSKALFLLVLAPLLVPLALSFAQEHVAQFSILADRYLRAFAVDAAGNDHRFAVWNAGGQLFGQVHLQEFLFGHGIGTTVANLNDGFPYSTHYESSFFQAFYEGGVVGILLRYLPAAIAVYLLAQSGAFRRPESRILVCWFVFYIVSVSIAPTAGAYHTQFVYFLAVGLSIAWSRPRRFRRTSNPSWSTVGRGTKAVFVLPRRPLTGRHTL